MKGEVKNETKDERRETPTNTTNQTEYTLFLAGTINADDLVPDERVDGLRVTRSTSPHRQHSRGIPHNHLLHLALQVAQ